MLGKGVYERDDGDDEGARGSEEQVDEQLRESVHVPSSGLNVFLGIAGLVLAVASLFAAIGGNLTSPYFTIPVVIIAIVGAFMLGLNAKAMVSRLGELADSRMEKAVDRAIESRMPDIGRIAQEKVDDALAEVERGLEDRMYLEG